MLGRCRWRWFDFGDVDHGEWVWVFFERWFLVELGIHIHGQGKFRNSSSQDTFSTTIEELDELVTRRRLDLTLAGPAVHLFEGTTVDDGRSDGSFSIAKKPHDGVDMGVGDVQSVQLDRYFGRIAKDELPASKEADFVATSLHIHSGGLNQGCHVAHGLVGRLQDLIHPSFLRPVQQAGFLASQDLGALQSGADLTGGVE